MFKIDYSEIEFVEVYGLRRSGNHAIIAWLLKNMCTKEVTNTEPLIMPFPDAGFISQRCGDVYHLNDVGSVWAQRNPAYLRALIDAYISMGAKKIILSYEDYPHKMGHYDFNKDQFYFLENSKKIVITRDLANTFASRIKRSMVKFGEPNWNKTPNPFFINQRLVTIWMFNELFKGTKIKYSDWLTSKEYRDQISKDLNVPNRDITSEISNAGGGSSFKNTLDKDTLLSRYKQIEFPKEIIKMLKSKDVSMLTIANYGTDYSKFEFNQMP